MPARRHLPDYRNSSPVMLRWVWAVNLRQGQDRKVGRPSELSARGVGRQEDLSADSLPARRCSCSCLSTPLHTYHFPGLGSNLSNLFQQITPPAHSVNLHPKDSIRVASSTPPFAETKTSAKAERRRCSEWASGNLLSWSLRWFPQAPAPAQ